MALDMKTQMRLTGMASGLDTDAVIQNLGKVSTMRIDKVKQDKQILQWRQDMYRETITKLTSFMKSNLNVSNPNSNLRSSAAFAKFNYSVKGSSAFKALNPGLDVSDFMSITANGDLKNFNQKVQAVAQLATRDVYTGKLTDLQGITTKGFSYYNLGIKDRLDGGGGYYEQDTKWASFGVSIDGTTKTITISTADLREAYGQESGGHYKVMAQGGTAFNDAIDAVIGKFVHDDPAADTDGIYMRKDDGSFVQIDEGEIYKWYEAQKNVAGFANPGNPDTGEKQSAIQLYFNSVAIYEANLDSALPLSPTSHDNVVDQIKTNIKNAEGFFVEDGGKYKAITESEIYKWYTDNVGALHGTNGAPANSTERNAAIDAYFGAHDIYKSKGPKTTTALANLINERIRSQFGNDFAGVVKATNTGELKFEKQGSTITIFDNTGFDAVSKGMGLVGGASTAGAVTGRKITDLIDESFFDVYSGVDGAPLLINGVSIMIKKDDTIDSVMKKINGSEAGVTLSYTASTGRFTLSSKLEGTASIIKMQSLETSMFFADAFGISRGDGYSAAQNFVGVINGEEYIRQSNSFTHEGMTFSFSKTFNATMIQDGWVKAGSSTDPNNPYAGWDTVPPAVPGFPPDPDALVVDGNGNYIPNMVIERDGLNGTTGKIKLVDDAVFIGADVTKNTEEIVKTIKNFVDEYNDMVTYINDLIKGKRIRKNGAIEYPPLSEEERKALSPEEVKLYDEKAKLGLMANESDLRKVLNDLRTSLYQKVEGVGLTLADIGITTNADYSAGGTLVVDENKLKAMLDRDFDGVVSLFTKSSSISSSEKDSKKLAQRAAENGIAQRLNDILTAAAGTSTGGDKGYLLKKAGMVNDRTQVDNAMTKQLADYDKKIDSLLERWYRQEQNYYAMFARMETAMSKLQAQQNSLAQIMAAGGGGGK